MTAAERLAEAQNRAEQMEVASNNLRAAAIDDVQVLKSQVEFMEEAFEKLRDEGIDRLMKAKELLGDTEEKLTNGGIPVFKNPERFDPQYPEKPESLADKIRDNMNSEEEKRKKQEELDKLRQMAESIGAKKDSSGANTEDKKDTAAEQGNNPEADIKPDGGEKKGGKIDLAALAAKANSIAKK
jgi:hypothetical protein